ncbi:MAG: EAL domain-containing protein, partial [Geminicoccaceae bacterium]
MSLPRELHLQDVRAPVARRRDRRLRASRGIGAAGLFLKLALLLVPAFSLPAAAGLYWLAAIDIKAEHDRLTARIGNAAARVASAIENHLYDGHTLDETDLPKALIGTLMSDQAVRCVELVGLDDRELHLTAPSGIGCTGQVIEASVEIPIYADEEYGLLVHLSLAEIHEAQHSRREFSLFMLLGGLAIALLAAWAGFRMIVGRPLARFLEAIRQSESSDAPSLVDHPARDELGRVARAFNAMQRRLAAESLRLRTALARIDRIYHATPALLCTLGHEGDLASVSNHWLRATGYRREEVIGQPLASFLAAASKSRFDEEVRRPLRLAEPIHDVPLVLCRRDGSTFDILFSAIPDDDGDEGDGRTALCVISDVSALKDAERRLEKLALTDPLSELLNRRGLLESLDRFLARPRPEGALSVALFIDLDDFKWINDTYGHEAGDELLRTASARLCASVRGDDMVARIGGDEFAVICRRVESKESAEQLAGRIIARFKEPFPLGPAMGHVSASVGIAFIDESHGTAEEVLRLADLAMYEAKQSGKSTFATYSEHLGHRVHKSAVVREQVRIGLKEGHFRLHFQPIVDIESGMAAGCEALMRLDVPGTGPVSPELFVAAAEETGQIMELGILALEEGIAALDGLSRGIGGSDFYMTVNISPKQLNDQLAPAIDRLVADRPHLAGRLVLEITETTLLQRSDDIARRLVELNRRGVRIALDDFGTGYSSLSHIQNFPVDIIKIDKSFIARLDGEGADRQRALAMIRATVSMAHDLGIRVVAEGVERESMLRALEECHVDLAQGFHHARAMPYDDLVAWLGERTKKEDREAPQ